MSTLAQSLARTLGTTSALGMESVDVDVNIGQDAILDEDGASVSPLAPATDEPIIEAQQTELAEEESEIELTDNEVESNDNDIETLESIQLHLEKSLEHGGLDTVSYEMLNVAMDHIYRKFGFGAASVLPSMESFNDDSLGMTTVSMEKVSDTLKTVKEGAAQTIKKLWFQLKEFLKGLFTFNLTVKKRAAAIGKAAASTNTESTPQEIKLYNAKYLTIGGKVPEKGALISGYSKMASSGPEISKMLVERSKLLGQLITEIINTVDKGEDASTEAIERMTAGIKADGQRLEGMSDRMVFSNAKFEYQAFGAGEGKSVIPGMKLLLDGAPDRGSDSDGYKVMSLSTSEIQKISKDVERMCDVLTSFDKAYDKNVMEKAITKQLPLLDQNKDGKTVAFKLSSPLKKGIRTELTVQRKYLSFLGKVNKAMLDYCAQSLQVAKKGAGKKEDAPKSEEKAPE